MKWITQVWTKLHYQKCFQFSNPRSCLIAFKRLFTGLSFDPDLDDSPTCWHGRKYTDCNRKRETIPGGCKWWHFFPDEDFDTHVQRFRQITNDVFEDKLAAIFDELPVWPDLTIFWRITSVTRLGIFWRITSVTILGNFWNFLAIIFFTIARIIWWL